MNADREVVNRAVEGMIANNKREVMDEAVKRLIAENREEVMAKVVKELTNLAKSGLRIEPTMELEKVANIEGPGEGFYEVMDPRSLYRGKSYSEWVCDWFNWFLSADADKRITGPVVFLRSLGLPNRITGAFISDVPNISPLQLGVTDSSNLVNPGGVDPNYPKQYINDPNIRVGSEELKIFEDQAVLVPVIVAYEIANVPYKDWGRMIEYTGPTIDYGDNPPQNDQLTINTKDVALPTGLEMKDFRITTPIFTAVIPETDYGRSIKDFLDMPVSPGSYPAMIEGYFVLLKFKEGVYWIHSWATGPRELNGVYFSELLYQVRVGPKRQPGGPVSNARPSRNVGLVRSTLAKKKLHDELEPQQIEAFRKYFEMKLKGRTII
jgi:hypothetical protein